MRSSGASAGRCERLRAARRCWSGRRAPSSAPHAWWRSGRRSPCAARCERSCSSWPFLALLAEVNVLAHDGVVLLQHDAVGVVATVLGGHVGVTGARRGAELDDRTYVL